LGEVADTKHDAEVLYRLSGGVATISFNRPQVLNALTRKMVAETNRALSKARNDSRVRVVVLTGVGRAFCAGEDLKEDRKKTTPLEFRDKILEYQRLTTNIYEMSKVVIAAVNGYALGGGCEIALSCDLIYAAESAKFGLPEVKVAQLITNAGLYRLPRLVGEKKAKEIALVGDMIDAAEAERIGMINRAVPDAMLMQRVGEVAKKIMNNAPLSVAMTKALIEKAQDSTFSTTMELETQAITALFTAEDREEGARAFAEKRAPKYRGV
jgi:enoyl-CoA hydratase/carnithine racemase